MCSRLVPNPTHVCRQWVDDCLMQAHIDWVAHNHLKGFFSCSLQPCAWCPCIHAKFSPSLILWRLEQGTQVTEKHFITIKHSEMNAVWNSATEKQTKISAGRAHKAWGSCVDDHAQSEKTLTGNFEACNIYDKSNLRDPIGTCFLKIVYISFDVPGFTAFLVFWAVFFFLFFFSGWNAAGTGMCEAAASFSPCHLCASYRSTAAQTDPRKGRPAVQTCWRSVHILARCL